MITEIATRCYCGSPADVYPFDEPMCWSCYAEGGGNLPAHASVSIAITATTAGRG